MAAGRKANRLCDWNGCKNPIKADAVRCHLHEGKDVHYEDIETIKARIEARKNASEVPSFISKDHGYSIHYVSDAQLQTSTLSDHTPIDVKTAQSVVSAVTEIPNIDKMEVPQVAFEAMESGFPAFQKSLSDHGISPQRISVLTLYGLDRTTINGTPHSDGEAYHEVVVLDRGTDQEVVVDPFVAIFAPVRKFNASVNDQLPSGYTPFGDIPWIGPVEDYVDGHYMKWSNFNYQDERVRQ